MEWRYDLHIGDRATAFSEMHDVQKKGFEKGAPMVFVKQKIEYKKEDSDDVAILEERSHVYLAAPATRRGVKQGMFALCALNRPNRVYVKIVEYSLQ